MKVAILSESEADETVIRVLVGGILGRPTEPVSHLSLRSRGWPAVRNVLPAVLRHLQYSTEAEALVVVADSNHTPTHQSHHLPDDADNKCRFCELQRIASRTIQSLRPAGNRQLIQIAIGLAIPSLEAWLRCGRDPDVTEAKWNEGLDRRHDPYSKNDLKYRVYGTDRPNLEHLKHRGVEEAKRLITDLATLENRFPAGFGTFATQIRGWLSR